MLSLRPLTRCEMRAAKRFPTVKLSRPVRAVVVRAYKEPDPPKSKHTALKKDERIERILEDLKSKGVNSVKAREMLQTWASLGARDPEEIKRLLVSRSMRPLTAIGAQVALDVVAALGGFYTGGLAGQGDFPGAILVSLLAYFFACYYAIQVFFEAGALAAILVAARRYSTDGEALAVAVQALAGPASGNRLLDKAAVAINTLELLRTLESIFEQLKSMAASGQLERSTLQNLSAYLTLQRAEELYGFVPAEYDLTEEQAADIAGVFSMFDANDNGLLEASELRQLCNTLGRTLTDEEVAGALKAMDVGAKGVVRFSDFVAWWTGKARADEGAPTPKAGAAA